MPCYSMRTTTQVVEGIKDINLLSAALVEMGFSSRVVNGVVEFSGQGNSGTYRDGKLTVSSPVDLDLLKKYTAIANLKKQVAANNADKYKKTKLTLTKQSEFEYTVSRS